MFFFPVKFSSMGNASASFTKPGAENLPAINDKPSALILDDKGRAIDSSGKALSLMSRMPTLKANIRAKKREAFLKVEKPTDDFADKTFFDSRVRWVYQLLVMFTYMALFLKLHNNRSKVRVYINYNNTFESLFI